MSAGGKPDPAVEGRLQSDAGRQASEWFEVWNRDGLAAFAERYWDPDVVWVEPAQFPDAGVRRGREACVKRMEERLSLLGHVQIEVVAAEAPLPGWRVQEVLVRGEGSSSGTPSQLREWFLGEVQDDVVLRWFEFLDRESVDAAIARIAAEGAP